MEPIASYTADISLGVFLDITLKRIIVSSQKFGVTILSSTGEFERLITDTGLVMQRACNNDVYATASDDGVIRVFDLNTG